MNDSKSARWFRRKREHAMDPKFEPLARYNGEVARGVTHTPEWSTRMAGLQAEFERGVEWGGQG